MNIVKTALVLVLLASISGCQKLTLENSYKFSQVAGGSHTSSFDSGVDVGPAYLDTPRADAYWQGRIEHYHLATKFNTPMTFKINYSTQQVTTYNPSSCVDNNVEFCEFVKETDGGYLIGALLNFSSSGIIYSGLVAGFSPDGGEVEATFIRGKIGAGGMAGAFHGTGISGGFFARP
ncbi:MAG: hypothetical protein K8953_06115 [Proteobacteria bacterium]|nr:hypothetical protein [Pseudomonadota bacterium]